MYLIGVDVGGTFTDIVFADTESGRTLIHKTPTIKDDPSRGVVAGIGELCARFDLPRQAIDHVLHGTTIGTNAVLEHDGAVTGMITTAGYRDIVHIGRHQRPQHYSIRQEIPWQDRPLVRRRHRLTVAERLVPPRGEELVPLDEAAVREAARALRDGGVEAIAICFLFSYLNPAHEERAREIVREEFRMASPAPPSRWRRNSASSNVLLLRCSTPLSGRGCATTWRGWAAASAPKALPAICM